jgi:hypothetical protein
MLSELRIRLQHFTQPLHQTKQCNLTLAESGEEYRIQIAVISSLFDPDCADYD